MFTHLFHNLRNHSNKLSNIYQSRYISVNTFSNGSFSWITAMSPYVSPYYSSQSSTSENITISDLDTELTIKNYHFIQKHKPIKKPPILDLRGHVDRH
tara:strand:- start:285 stop:578 length:294 start_codon:yes stop_codon:yes gene_type:complete